MSTQDVKAVPMHMAPMGVKGLKIQQKCHFHTSFLVSMVYTFLLISLPSVLQLRRSPAIFTQFALWLYLNGSEETI